MSSLLRIPAPNMLFEHPVRWVVSHLAAYAVTVIVITVGFFAFSAGYATFVAEPRPDVVPVKFGPPPRSGPAPEKAAPAQGRCCCDGCTKIAIDCDAGFCNELGCDRIRLLE